MRSNNNNTTTTEDVKQDHVWFATHYLKSLNGHL